MKHILSVLVENEPGVLTRVTGLFARRGFNIESLSVSPSLDENISQITMVVYGDKRTIEQIVKQLYKLINVRKVQNFNYISNITRELMLIKLKMSTKTRAEILDIKKIFKKSFKFQLGVDKTTIFTKNRQFSHVFKLDHTGLHWDVIYMES